MEAKLLHWTRALNNATAASFVPESKLGGGSFGVVLLCRPSETVQKLGLARVALKCLYNLGMTTSRLRNEFESEFKVLSELPFHPHIVQILGQFVDVPSPAQFAFVPDDIRALAPRNLRTGVATPLKTQFVVMEHHPQSLEAYLLEQGPNVTGEEVLAFGSQLASALLFLWEQRLVHRDLKLSNVLFDRARRAAVLCDFGLAARVGEDGCVAYPAQSAPGGNSAHLAPEVLNSHHALRDGPGRVDFSGQPAFELGVLLFEMACGEHPFGSYPLGCGRAGAVELPARPASLPADAPLGLGALLGELLAPAAADRPSVAQALQRLQALAGQVTQARSTTTRTQSRPRV